MSNSCLWVSFCSFIYFSVFSKFLDENVTKKKKQQQKLQIQKVQGQPPKRATKCLFPESSSLLRPSAERVRVIRSQPCPAWAPPHLGPTPAWAPPHRGRTLPGPRPPWPHPRRDPAPPWPHPCPGRALFAPPPPWCPSHLAPPPAWGPSHRGPAPGNPATFTRLSLSFIIGKCGAKAHRRTRRAPACRGQAAEPKTRGWGHRSGSDRRTLPGKSPGNSAPHRHPDFRFLPQNWEGIRGPLFPVPQETHTPHISGHLGGRDLRQVGDWGPRGHLGCMRWGQPGRGSPESRGPRQPPWPTGTRTPPAVGWVPSQALVVKNTSGFEKHPQHDLATVSRAVTAKCGGPRDKGGAGEGAPPESEGLDPNLQPTEELLPKAPLL